jgi:diguanylate cyclase
VLSELHDLGIKVAIDDFGTGYASLAYVSSLPVDSLKIDRAFVLDVTSGGQGASIVQFSIQLGRSLGIAVVAEGIEDAETLARLTELGCDEAQGYYVSRPLAAPDLDAWFETSGYVPASLSAGASAGAR